MFKFNPRVNNVTVDCFKVSNFSLSHCVAHFYLIIPSFPLKHGYEQVGQNEISSRERSHPGTVNQSNIKMWWKLISHIASFHSHQCNKLKILCYISVINPEVQKTDTSHTKYQLWAFFLPITSFNLNVFCYMYFVMPLRMTHGCSFWFYVSIGRPTSFIHSFLNSGKINIFYDGKLLWG